MSENKFVIAMNPEDYYKFKCTFEQVQVFSLEEPKDLPTRFSLFLSEHSIIPTLAVDEGTYWFGPIKDVMDKACLI